MRLERRRIRVGATGRLGDKATQNVACVTIREELVAGRSYLDDTIARSIVGDDTAELKAVDPVVAESRDDDAAVGSGHVGQPNPLAAPHQLHRANDLVVDDLSVDPASCHGRAHIPDVDTAGGSAGDDVGDP